MKYLLQKFYKKQVKTFSPDVLILIDHIAREMEFAIILKDLIEEAGLSVEVVTTKFNIYRLPVIFKTDYVVTPWVYTNREANIFSRIKSKNKESYAQVINLHFEQISGEASKDFMMPKDLAKICWHLSWSKDFSTELLKLGIPRNSILEFGTPKLDKYPNQKIKHNSINQVLIAGNAFHLWEELELSRFQKNGFNVYELSRVGKLNLRFFLNDLEEGLKNYPEINFIYRPHPQFAERDHNYGDFKRLLSMYQNFNFDTNVNIRNALLESDMLISFHSTSYLEAVKSNIPYIIYRYEDLKKEDELDDLKDWPIKLSEEVSLVELLKSNNINERLETKYNQIKNKYFISDIGVADRLMRIIIDKETLQYSMPKNLLIELKNNFIAVFLYMFNMMSERSSMFKDFLIKHNDFKVNNLAYRHGRDFFERDFFDQNDK